MSIFDIKGQKMTDVSYDVMNKMGYERMTLYNSPERTQIQREYNKALIEKGLAMSRSQIKKLNRIDVRPLLFDDDDNGKDSFQIPFKRIQNLMEKDGSSDDFQKYSDKHRFFGMIPCFQEGCIQITRDRYIYWKIKDINIKSSEENHSMKIFLKDYIAYENYWQPGTEGIMSVKYVFGNGQEPITISDCKLFSDIFRQISPTELRWNKSKADFFKDTVITMADYTEEKQAKHNMTDNFMSLCVIFQGLITIINYRLYKNKPVADRKANKAKTKIIAQTVDTKQPRQLIRNVGCISIKSVKPPRHPSEETVIHYKVASWTARGGVRHMKDGRVIPFKESVHHRQCLKDKQTDIPTNIIRVRKDLKDE